MEVLRQPALGCLAAAWLVAAGAAAQPPSAEEYQIKAAFLYNFAKFVEWPGEGEGNVASLIIAVFGRDPIGEALEQTVAGKTIRGHPLAVRRLTRLSELKHCHVLFVSASERSRAPEIVQAAGHFRVLTVGETDEFLDQGGMINFLLQDNKLRFEIHVGAIRRAGLTISSKLLILARGVRE